MLSLLFFAFLTFGAVASEEITKLSNVLISDLYGRTITLNNTEGRCVLIVNTGSVWSDKYHYVGQRNMHWLNGLAAEFPGLVVLAVPSNTLGTEPKNNEQLREWFGIWMSHGNGFYQVLDKTDWRKSDLFRFLIKRSGYQPGADFSKYLVQKDGISVEFFGNRAGAVRWRELEPKLTDCINS